MVVVVQGMEKEEGTASDSLCRLTRPPPPGSRGSGEMNASAEYNDTDEVDDQLNPPQYFSYRYRIVGTFFIGVVFIVGVLGNAMVVLVVTRVRALHSPTNCYLLSLAVADTVVLLAAVPNEILSYYLVGNQWIWGDVGCAIFIFCQNLGINASSLSLVAFTVERYIAICHPMKAHKMCTRGHAERITLVVWCFATLYCSPWLGLTKTEPLQYRGYPDLDSCVFRLPRNKYLMYFFTDLVMFYVVPLILSCIFYTLISVSLISRPVVAAKESNVNMDGTSAHSKSKTQRAQMKTWDRNNVRSRSSGQFLNKNFATTAVQLGLPPSMGNFGGNDIEVPKMQCTTTTRSDYRPPVQKRFTAMTGERIKSDLSFSIGLENDKERSSARNLKDTLTVNRNQVPHNQLEANDCPHRSQQWPAFSNSLNNLSQSASCMIQPKSSTPQQTRLNLNYFPNQSGSNTPNSNDNCRHDQNNINDGTKENTGLRSTNRDLNNMDYQVEGEEYFKQKLIHQSEIEKARMEYEKNIGVPGSTAPIVHAGRDAPTPTANYNVPDYTKGAPTGGLIKPRYGEPVREMKIPVSDSSYDRPQFKIPTPEPGLKRINCNPAIPHSYQATGREAFPQQVRYPDQLYESAALSNGENDLSERYSSQPRHDLKPEDLQHLEETPAGELSRTKNPEADEVIRHKGNNTQLENRRQDAHASLKENLRRIQTTNQVYGSWANDPFLVNNDWWFKSPLSLGSSSVSPRSRNMQEPNGKILF